MSLVCDRGSEENWRVPEIVESLARNPIQLLWVPQCKFLDVFRVLKILAISSCRISRGNAGLQCTITQGAFRAGLEERSKARAFRKIRFLLAGMFLKLEDIP
jgi:hypothetical protein